MKIVKVKCVKHNRLMKRRASGIDFQKRTFREHYECPICDDVVSVTITFKE